MFCPTCGKENPDNAKICGYCGNAMPLAEETEQSQPTENAPQEPIAPVVPAPAEPQEEKKSRKGLIITLSCVGATLLLVGTAVLLYALGVFDKKATPVENVNSVISSATNESGAIITGADDYSSYISENSSENTEASSEAPAMPETSTDGKEEPNFKPNPASALIGKWKGNYNLTELAGIETEVPITIEFNHDNTFSMRVEEEDLETFCKEILELSAEMAEVSVDELLEEAEMTMDEYIEEAKTQYGGSLSATGSYSVKGNELYMAVDGEELESAEAFSFNLEENVLKLDFDGVELALDRIG